MTKRSDKTRALMREKAQQRGDERSGGIEQQVRVVMKTIEKEMADNDGLYPHNKGAVNLAEVARRAEIHNTTLFSPKQRDFGKEVKTWLELLKAEKVVGRGPVRREMSERVADWKRLYDGLAQSHRDTELELQQALAEKNELQVELTKLQREHDRTLKLLAVASGEKVVPLQPKRR